jgi:hypothetical protein
MRRRQKFYRRFPRSGAYHALASACGAAYLLCVTASDVPAQDHQENDKETARAELASVPDAAPTARDAEAASTDAAPGSNEVARVADALPARDPFWPVGYVKPEPRPDTGGPDPDDPQTPTIDKTPPPPPMPAIVWPALVVRSVATGGKQSVALIDRLGMVQAGDKPEWQVDKIVYRWLILDVSDKGVSYRRLDATPVGREDQRVVYEGAAETADNAQ